VNLRIWEKLMSEIRDREAMRAMMARLLKERTGEEVESWNRRIRDHGFKDETALRQWLAHQGVTSYAQTLVVMEHFGYPDFLLASVDEQIEAQYADRPQLPPVLDKVIQSMTRLGPVAIQALKGYVSFLTPRKTFARRRITTKNRADLALRLEGVEPGGRLVPSKIQKTMQVQLPLHSPGVVDSEVLDIRRVTPTTRILDSV
jgi:hypothetical protein